MPPKKSAGPSPAVHIWAAVSKFRSKNSVTLREEFGHTATENRRSSEIQGTALGQAHGHGPVYNNRSMPQSGRHRAQELCESRGGRPGLPVPNKPCGFCGR